MNKKIKFKVKNKKSGKVLSWNDIFNFNKNLDNYNSLKDKSRSIEIIINKKDKDN